MAQGAPNSPSRQASAARMRKRTFDVDFINPFLQAVIDVLTTMAQVVPTPGRPFLKESTFARGEVSGIISVSGYSNGSIALTFPEDCAKVIVGNMLNESIREMGPDVYDGVGELTNMISGQARKGLATQGMKFHAGIPKVLHGKGHTVVHPTSGPVIGIPFNTPFGDLTVEVSLS